MHNCENNVIKCKGMKIDRYWKGAKDGIIKNRKRDEKD